MMGAVERLLEGVRPALLRDGGNVELVKIEKAVVYVRLTGACRGCASSSATLKYLVENTLKANIHPDVRVEECM
ncbi:MAG: NifU family protein [Helicobacteraceae bacterium]|nr:NifU family protein [Helicobacteraceae bacterium]